MPCLHGRETRQKGNNMKLQTVKITDLKFHPKNPNTHPEFQVKELQNSLDQFDQVKNIVVWQGLVIAGNGLLEAAKLQNRETIEIQDVSDWPEEKALKFMIADNRIPQLAIMDDDILSGLLTDFDEPLDIPGIDEDFLDGLDLDGGLEGDGGGQEHKTLTERFGVPPFSVLDARQGYWQDRKKAWLSLGIQSEIGRGGGC